MVALVNNSIYNPVIKFLPKNMSVPVKKPVIDRPLIKIKDNRIILKIKLLMNNIKYLEFLILSIYLFIKFIHFTLSLYDIKK